MNSHLLHRAGGVSGTSYTLVTCMFAASSLWWLTPFCECIGCHNKTEMRTQNFVSLNGLWIDGHLQMLGKKMLEDSVQSKDLAEEQDFVVKTTEQ